MNSVREAQWPLSLRFQFRGLQDQVLDVAAVVRVGDVQIAVLGFDDGGVITRKFCH